MMRLEYTVVDPEMVWLSYKENGDKHLKELLGKDAIQFLKFIKDVELNGNAALNSLVNTTSEKLALQVKSDESRSDA